MASELTAAASGAIMGIGKLARSIGARRIKNASDCYFSSVSIDSRNVKEESLFFALNGKTSDGHSFVKDAFEKGACAAVVESSKLESFNLIETAKKYKKDLVVVNDTLKSLQDSARVYLEMFPNLIKVGITGSSGKTTTKEIAASIISCERKTVMNKGNLNSETGLPLSVFEVRKNHEVGIFELGMNRPGEINEIAFVLKPNIACITNIGTAHIEFFGSKDKILDEKKNIFKFLNNDDTAVIPAEQDYTDALAKGVNAKISFYGKNNFCELQNIKELGIDGTEITWAGKKANFALPGKHCLHDAMAAIAIAKEIKISDNAIVKGLESVKPLFGRQQIIKGSCTVICDCYNANPESMEQSIGFCDAVERKSKNSRKIYVIGQMLELGNYSIDAHKKLGQILKVSNADKIFLFGSETAHSYEILKESGKDVFYTGDFNALFKAVEKNVKEGDFVLLKGSRFCALERLLDIFTRGIK